MQYDRFFSGEYQIEKLLERSQYSVLGLGKSTTTEQHVLLKLWLTAQVNLEEGNQVREEVAHLQSARHSHLLPILEVQADDQKVFLVSEYAPGGSLNERLGQEGKEAFTLDETLQIIEQVGQALQELHTHGITHGNLTPQAVFFSEPGQAKVGEFLLRSVLASIQDYQHSLDENVPRCFYMAPEQFSGTLNAKTDQYALGCLAYVLLTNRVPFAGSTRATLQQKHQHGEPLALTAVNPAVPAHVEAVILRSLAKHPEERYSSVQDLLEALDISGQKALADMATQKQPVASVLLGETGAANKVWEWTETGQPKSSALVPLSTALIVRPTQKRERYVILSMVLLVLLLLFMTGRWLMFSNGSSAIQPRGTVVSTSPTSVQLTPATATNLSGQTTATVIAMQMPTPTSPPAPPFQLPPAPTATTTPTQVEVSLKAFFNNKGIGTTPGQANFDGSGYSYPASKLPPGGLITLKGVPYQFPSNAARTNDNLTTSGQTIPLTQGKYHTAFLLASSSWGPVSATVTIRYTDGSTTAVALTILDWYTNGPLNSLSTPYRYTSSSIEQHPVYIYVIPITLNATRIASTLLLPGSQSGPHPNGHIHIFALTLQP